MLDQRFPSPVTPSDDFHGRLEGGERAMWQGRTGVAEYAFERPASLPRWTLPESTDVLVTNRRVLYSYASDARDMEIVSGELRWLWPQHLRVQPGARSAGRVATASQIQLVCAAADGGFPALVFAGGDLVTVGDADRLANVLRHAIARFRVDHADKLGLTTQQSRMLSRLLIGPEFSNHQGGDGQTVSLAGALLVTRPAPTPAATHSEPAATATRPVPTEATASATHSVPNEAATRPEPTAAATRPAPAEAASRPAPTATATHSVPAAAAAGGGLDPRPEPERAQADPTRENATRMMNARPGLQADAKRAWRAAQAEQKAHQVRPDRATRAAELAARVADMVSRSDDESAPPEQPDEAYSPAHLEVPTINLAERAEAIRRAEARFAANSARGRAGVRREAG
jgi:hypothetical protein